MPNKVLSDVMNKDNFDAGTKARNDVNTILNDLGFESIILFNRTHNNIFRILEVLKAIHEIDKGISAGDFIVLQYPYNPRMMKLILKKISKVKYQKGCKLIILIHDVVYMRNESGMSKTVEEMKKLEIEFFNYADSVIVHNQIMKNELLKAGVNTPMFKLQIFDYLYSGKTAIIEKSDVPIIVFAGNLSPEKSGFIYNFSIDNDFKFNLYGNNPSKLPDNFVYKGSFPPDELIANLEGNFGLVWDGPTQFTCEGNYGNYLRYNNPHKFSLYMSAGLPAIVWDKSALAHFVKKNRVGIVVSSLSDLKNLPKFDSEEYIELVKNVKNLKKKVEMGNMLKTVIYEIKNKIR